MRKCDRQTPQCDLECDVINLISARHIHSLHTPYHVTETIPSASYWLISTSIRISAFSKCGTKCKVDMSQRLREIRKGVSGGDVLEGANLPIPFLILRALGQSGPIHPIGLPPPPFDHIINQI